MCAQWRGGASGNIDMLVWGVVWVAKALLGCCLAMRH